LVADHKRRFGIEKCLRDFVGEDPVKCWEGYDESGNELCSLVNLKDEFNDDGSQRRPSRDYCDGLRHSEEEDIVLQKSTMIYSPEALLSSKEIKNIDFDSSVGNNLEINKFNGLVFNDLILRGYEPSSLYQQYSPEERRRLLKSHMKIGREIRMIRNTLEIEKTARRTQFVEVDRAIPCILHANNRTAEKLLEQLILVALHSCLCRKDKNAMVHKIEDCVNHAILAKMKFNDLGQWRLPMEGDKLGDIKLSCMDANKLVDKIGLLVEVCTENLPPEKQDDWSRCCALYALTMEKLKSRKVFTFLDVCDFQNTADDFAELYINLTGWDGMTNYFHFLSAGHFSFYLLRVKNLYKYSQQGWEHINGKAKRTYHNNTQKGGGRNGSSKLLPIVYSSLRELLWRFNYGDALFSKFEDKTLNYGKRKKQIKVPDDAIDFIAQTILNLGNIDDIYGDVLTEIEHDEIDLMIGEV
jgi:hypothetical protein